MRWRLLAAFVGLTALVLIVINGPLLPYLRRVETDRLLASVERDAFVIAGTAEDVLVGSETRRADLRSTLDLYARRHGAMVVVTDGSGIVIGAGGDGEQQGDELAGTDEVASALEGTPTRGNGHSEAADRDVVFAAVPILSGVDVVGVVRIAYPSAVVDRRTGDKVRGLAVAGAISLIGAAVAALFITATLTRPLRRLRDGTERLAAGDLSVRVDDGDGPPEIRNLARSFNTMAEQLSDLIDSQRGFAGNASHQLRTPLTALRLQLEQAAALVGSDPQAARERIEAAGHETERLQQIVSGLLLLSRVEVDGSAVSDIELGSLLRDRVELWSALAEEQRLTVDADLDDVRLPTYVSAMPGAVEQIVDNLVDNAVKVSPAGAVVSIAVDADDRFVSVDVDDEGAGMTPEQLRVAGTRFWRASDAPHPGSGLGLAIAEHLARASRATIDLANRPAGGLRATLRLSRSPRPPNGDAAASTDRPTVDRR